MQEEVGRGLGLLHAHGTAMARALRGQADWDAVDIEDPLRTRDSVSGSMSDEEMSCEMSRKALDRELANVDEVLANIERVEFPHGAVGSFVNILAVRQTSRCAPKAAS